MENFESNGCARRARKLCGEAHWGGDLRARENALELQGGQAPAESPDQAIARESTLDKRRRRYGRAGVHTENAWKQTRRQRFGVAGRKTSERSENTRGVAGRAASTGRVGSGIQETEVVKVFDRECLFTS